MSPQLEPVAALDGIKTNADDPVTPSHATVEQLLYGTSGESSRWPSSASPLSRKENNMEGDQPNQKKSLFSKMKEKARKLQHSLSNRKKDDTTSPPGVRQEDNEVGEEEENPEYLGAPMYESEKAPEALKETARQHPRAEPVISEKHVLSSPAKQGVEQEKDKSVDSNNTIAETITEKTGTETVPESSAPADVKGIPVSPSKTVSETLTEQLAPAYARDSDATQAITSKIQGLAVSDSTAPETERNGVSGINKDVIAGSEAKTASYGEQVWDKGVSVKEFIMQKFEPGEDDRALSQAISNAISPRGASDDTGVVGRVKDAVSSLIWEEESKNPRAPKSAPNSPHQVPKSTNTHEIIEEENHGRILQPN